MKKKFKVTLIVFLVVIFGCFSETFAATKVGTKLKKNVQFSMNKNLLDNTTSNEAQLQPIHRYTFSNDNGNTIVDTGTMTEKDGTYDGTVNDTKIITEDGTTFRRFNGNRDCIKFKSQIIPIGKKTIAFTARMESNKANRMLIFANQNGTGTYGYGEQCEVTGGIVQWTIFKAVGGRPIFGITSSKSINDGQWHNVVMTWDGTTAKNAVKIYIDDLSVPNVQATATTVETKNAPCNLAIGNEYGCYFEGDLQNFEVYNDVLIKNCESISLNKTTDSLILKDSVKGTDILTATVTPDSATNKAITWKSSDENIVKVDQNGNITATGKGTATITAETTDGSNLKDSCTIVVNDPTSITLNKTRDLINVGESDKLIATVTPTGQTVTWTSNDDSIITVDSNGHITGIRVGTAVITATTVDGKTASCTVTVKEKETEKFKLTLYMNNATTREFYLTQDEIDDFLNWYTSKTKGEVTLQPYYVFNVSVPGTSSTKKSYVWFMKIESFEIE